MHFVLFEPGPCPRRTKRTLEVHYVLRGSLGHAEQDEMHPERRVMVVAGGQHGCVSTVQLLDAGLSHRAIAHRVSTGWLVRRHRGVYLVGPLEATLSAAMAAVLAVGSGALLSHRSAGVVWEVLPAPAGVVDVTLADREARHRVGIRVHQASHLLSEDLTVYRGLPVTTPARTLLDLASILMPSELERALGEAERRGLITHAQLADYLSRRRSCRGAANLRAALGTVSPQLTRSEAERRFLALVDRAGLPTPAANTRVAGYEVDFLWPAQRLIVEIDGYAFHASRTAFERDRIRDSDLQARGYRLIRITWRRLIEAPEAVVAAIATALAAA